MMQKLWKTIKKYTYLFCYISSKYNRRNISENGIDLGTGSLLLSPFIVGIFIVFTKITNIDATYTIVFGLIFIILSIIFETIFITPKKYWQPYADQYEELPEKEQWKIVGVVWIIIAVSFATMILGLTLYS